MKVRVDRDGARAVGLMKGSSLVWPTMPYRASVVESEPPALSYLADFGTASTGPITGGGAGGPVGVKYDSDKPRMDLLPPRALLEVAKVLSFGASKYAPGNWKRVDDLQARYTAAALRHLADHMINPNAVDEESHIDTLAHAICCLMFKLEDKLEKDQGTSARKADES